MWELAPFPLPAGAPTLVALLPSAAAYRLVGAGLMLAGTVAMNLAQQPRVSHILLERAGRGAIMHGFSQEMGAFRLTFLTGNAILTPQRPLSSLSSPTLRSSAVGPESGFCPLSMSLMQPTVILLCLTDFE